MTDYGRGHGSQPWHPDDPLYGDQEWDGGRQPEYQGGWNEAPQQGQYSGHPGAQQYAEQQYQHQPQQQYPHPQQQYGHNGWDGTQQAAPGAGQHYDPAFPAQQYTGHPADPYGTGEYRTGEYSTGEYPAGGYGTGEYRTGEYATGEYRTGEYPTGEYATGEYQTGGYPNGAYSTGEYPTGTHYTEYPSGEYSTGEYRTGEYPTGEYATGEYPAGERTGEYGTGEHPGYYAQQGGYPAGPPAPHPQQAPVPGQRQAPGSTADPETGWDPGPDQGEHAFFQDRDGDPAEDDYDDYDEDEDRGRRGREGGRRRGRGCGVVITAALVAGVSVVGYYGYDFYQTHFGPAPDYAGDGSGEVMVDIPDGASLSDMGEVLRKEGVVKSPGAFVEAAGNKSIQAGTYTLRKKMSGASAVEMMLDPASQNGLIVAEGWRATRIYAEIDKKLDVPKGTTKKAAASGGLGLPAWAHGKPEGFLFPSKYSVGKNSKPKDVLRQMVKRAEAEYAKAGLEKKAKDIGKTPEQVITIASLVQAEAQEDHEFGKVSRVVYNRLDKDMQLGFDSTINYAMGRSTLNTSVADTKYPSPYNTYLHKGLPPGPIGNPGHQAIEAALKPTKGNWLYFVTVKPGDTRFTDDPHEHQKNVEDFNKQQRK
ncbi:endolytic transglycosylase MltG [Streptomyces oryzae]|uniref:Endolytic murein transglycosylase n=1 Tax=Streptomyces oryzae TaxID=1434886 RepID=A0ABS3XHY2_9ACTN|nr:endolytic transglycosylase MltG [Streptomyces oryzae]MBO8194911.1 endolytic transglycosylase MltG [Streptomyces oryzae]